MPSIVSSQWIYGVYRFLFAQRLRWNSFSLQSHTDRISYAIGKLQAIVVSVYISIYLCIRKYHKNQMSFESIVFIVCLSNSSIYIYRYSTCSRMKKPTQNWWNKKSLVLWCWSIDEPAVHKHRMYRENQNRNLRNKMLKRKLSSFCLHVLAVAKIGVADANCL